MTKVGILTLHGASNYGAVLQALGLCEYLGRMGLDSEVIDFRPSEVCAYYDYHILSGCVSLRSVVGKILRRRRNEREYAAFEAFRQESLRLSPRCETLDELRSVMQQYDAVICGSDQVWNPEANGGLLDAYYLGFLDSSKTRKISYAASFGNVACARGIEGDIARYLSNYAGISVRESEAVDFVSSITGQDVVRVIDPSMLLSADDYSSYEGEIETPERFVLTYMLQGNDLMAETVARAQAELGLPVVSLGRRMRGSTFRKDIGPGEFLTLYRRADAVLTNSFHGTAFSLLYCKPFVTYGNGRYNSRMETLLEIAGQRDRFIVSEADTRGIANRLTETPHPAFESVVSREREKAHDFLFHSLGM